MAQVEVRGHLIRMVAGRMLVLMFLIVTVVGATERAGLEASKTRRHLLTFIETLEPGARSALMRSLDAPDRLQSRVSPAPRPGLRLLDLTDEQVLRLHVFLGEALGERGYETMRAIFSNQDRLGEKERGLGWGYFWLAVYGDPTAAGTAWSWRLGGHHGSLNLTYIGNDLISWTPAQLGVSTRDVRGAHPDVLDAHEQLGRTLIATLDVDARAKANLSDVAARSFVIGAARDVEFNRKVGITAGALAEETRLAVWEVIESYSRLYPPLLTRRVLEHWNSLSLDDVYVAWAGARPDADDFYYRVSSPTFLFELHRRNGHIHVNWRTVNDYGQQSLR